MPLYRIAYRQYLPAATLMVALSFALVLIDGQAGNQILYGKEVFSPAVAPEIAR